VTIGRGTKLQTDWISLQVETLEGNNLLFGFVEHLLCGGEQPTNKTQGKTSFCPCRKTGFGSGRWEDR